MHFPSYALTWKQLPFTTSIVYYPLPLRPSGYVTKQSRAKDVDTITQLTHLEQTLNGLQLQQHAISVTGEGQNETDPCLFILNGATSNRTCRLVNLERQFYVSL